MRRRPGAAPGVTGVARLDRRTARLASRLNPGDIAVIDHVDLDKITAETLLAAKPAAIVNAQPSISGRYPNLGPELIVSSGVLLLDAVGPEVFGAVKEGTRIRVAGDTVFVGDHAVAQGDLQDAGTLSEQMAAANAGLSAQLEAFAVNAGEVLGRERELLLEGAGLPVLRTKLAGRHVLIAVRGHDYEADLKRLKHYIREYHPVLVGIEGGADALLDAGYQPDLIVGDMDAVSEGALLSGAEVIVRANPDGRSPSLPRVQDLGVDAQPVATALSGEDLGILLADHADADLIVTVGTHATLNEFLDKGRAGMASSFLTRLRVGSRLLDADGVSRLYRNRISAWALLLLVVAALVAIIAVLIVADQGNTYIADVKQWWNNVVDWVQGRFS